MTASVDWLRRHDRGLAATPPATRAALVMPAMFALGYAVIDDPAVATFAAFGSFAMLLLVDFAGPMERLQAQAALAVTDRGASSARESPARGTAWLAAPGDGARRLRRPVRGRRELRCSPGPPPRCCWPSSCPFASRARVGDPRSPRRRGLAAGAALLAIALLWPAPARDPVRGAASPRAARWCRAPTGRGSGTPTRLRSTRGSGQGSRERDRRRRVGGPRPTPSGS